MSGFAADWLRLREDADRRARAPSLVDAFVAHLAPRDAVVVTDLACGAGATVRALHARLPMRQHWRLVDHDDALLAHAVVALAAPHVGASPIQGTTSGAGAGVPTLETRHADLHVDLAATIALEADAITTSAFLDLVSAAWLDRLVAATARHRRAVYAALSYDGRVACAPADPLDAEVLAAFDAHQRRDKGLGAALGPAAAGQAAHRFEAAGFTVSSARADWSLGARDAALQRRLIDGWHRAVSETGAVAGVALDAWRDRRLARVEDGSSRLGIGHLDLLAIPGSGRR